MSKKKSFTELLRNSPIPVLVDFYADWCGPCKTLSPIVQQVSSELHGRVKIIKVNVDKNQSASMKFGIKGVPTLILFEKGNILWRQSGLVAKGELKQSIEKHLS